MKKEMGLWIDHKETILVIITDDTEELKPFRSNIEKHIRYSGASHSRNQTDAHDDWAEDIRDRRFGNLLNNYYDGIISCLLNADSILIMGPGEAKVELKKRIECRGLGTRIVGVETTDKMTPEQILAKVHQYFQK
jgi:hypothetical protein